MNLITTDKILVLFIILILSFVIYYMLKSVFKIILIIAIAVLLYSVYLNYNEKKNFDSLQQGIDKTIKELDGKKEKANKIFDFIDKAMKF